MSVFTVDLEKRMIASKDLPSRAQEQLLLDEANNILTNVDAEKLTVLKRMGLDDNVSEGQQLASLNEKFDTARVFTKKEIKSVCVAYGLRFLPTEYFKGTIDPALPGKILEFERKYPSPDGEPYDYHIAAPKASFKLQARPKDPLVFASIGKDKWFLVHKWGNDLSIMNWVANFPRATMAHVAASATLLGFVITCIVSAAIAVDIILFGTFCISAFILLLFNMVDGQPNSESWNSKFS